MLAKPCMFIMHAGCLHYTSHSSLAKHSCIYSIARTMLSRINDEANAAKRQGCPLLHVWYLSSDCVWNNERGSKQLRHTHSQNKHEKNPSKSLGNIYNRNKIISLNRKVYIYIYTYIQREIEL